MLSDNANDRPAQASSDPESEALSHEAEIAAWFKGKIAQSLEVGQMLSGTVTISPETAAYILKYHNDGNRPIRHKRVKNFVNALKDGRWKLTAQGISFAPDGKINNGQHRLRAIVESGIATKIYLTFGESREVFDVIDTHTARGGKDAAALAGFKNPTSLAAAVRLLVLIEEDRPFKQDKVENDALVAYVRNNSAIHDIVTMGIASSRRFRCSQAGITAALYMIHSRTKHKDEFGLFTVRLHDGVIPSRSSPIIALRDGLMSRQVEENVKNGNWKVLAQYSAVINAWNLHVAGRKGSLSNLIWKGRDPLPVPQ